MDPIIGLLLLLLSHFPVYLAFCLEFFGSIKFGFMLENTNIQDILLIDGIFYIHQQTVLVSALLLFQSLYIWHLLHHQKYH